MIPDAVYELEMSRALLQGHRRRLSALPPGSPEATWTASVQDALLAASLKWQALVERDLREEAGPGACPVLLNDPPAERGTMRQSDEDTCDHGKPWDEPCFFCRRLRDTPRRAPEPRNSRPATDPRRGITVGRGKPSSRLPV